MRNGTRYVFLGLVAGVAGCSAERVINNTPRTAMQQLVVTESADRAVRRIQWPKLRGRRIFVETASPAAADDQAYLRKAVAAQLGYGGAMVVEDRAQAEFVATVFAGSLGTEQSSKFVGIPSMQSVLLPVPFPEIAIYKSLRQSGFAKVEVVITEPATGRVIYRDGPESAESYWTEFTVLLFGFYRTDTSRRPSGVVETLKTIPRGNGGAQPSPTPATPGEG